MHDVIELHDLRFPTIIGILDAEQRAPQPVYLDLDLEVPLEAAAASGDLGRGVNYADVQIWLQFLAQQGRFRLLESLAVAACRLLLAPPAPCEHRARIQAVFLRIRKPTILVDAVPGVRLRRDHTWCDLHEVNLDPGVRRGTLVQSPTEAAWRVALDPQARWAAPADQAVLVLGGQVSCGSRVLDPAATLARGPREPLVAGPDGAVLLVIR